MSSNNEILNLMTVKVPMIMNKETLKIKIIIIIKIKKVIITILKIHYRISPYIISTISSRQVMRIKKNFN